MNTLTRFVTRIYAGLLRLYPGDFRVDFGDEMRSVFAAAIVVSTVFLIVLAALMTVLIVSWRQGFPRWSLPLWALMLVLSLYMMNAATPGLWFFGYSSGQNGLWGWRSWIPLAMVAVIALAWTRSLRPLGDLIGGVWRDWTRLSFAVYGLMPFVLVIAFDEMIGDELVLVALNIVLALGALVYMRVTQDWQRALVLLLAVLVCWLAATMFAAAYWSVPHAQGLAWVTPWESTVRNMLTMGGGILVVMFAPVLLGLIRRAVNRLRPA